MVTKDIITEGSLAFANLFWMNEKVLRIENISYLEELRKSSVYIKNWHVGNLVEVCSFVKRNSKAKTLYVSVKAGSKKEIAILKV